MWYNGSIDQVRIFNRAITATEVETLYDEVQCIPTIVPSEHFEPVLYTGNGGTQSITSLDFQPDLVWMKARNLNAEHILSDSVRGVNKELSPNNTYFEEARGVVSFDSNGFSLNSNFNYNDSTGTYVAWNWKAGGADVLNEEGTIDSQVSANVDAGFSIVSYTGNGSTSTVGHGLSSTVELLIVKGRETTNDWSVLHKDGADGEFLQLNGSSAQSGSGGVFGNPTARPTDSVFTIGSGGETGTLNKTYIAYCFHSVDGYSKIGSYTGTGASGNTIVTGFRPAFVMIKATNLPSDWYMIDNKRPNNKFLGANKSNAEFTSSDTHTFTSNGFTLSGASFNNSGYDWVFMAFAEEAFVPDNFFNDDSTVATYKLNGDAGDDSGNGHNGTASNVTYAAGKFDEAAVFNGSNINTNLSLNNLTDYTISLWLNPTGGAFFGGTINSSAKNGFYFQYSSNVLYWVEVNASATVSNLTITGAVNTGSWNHIVFVRNGGTNYIYVNNGTPVSVSNGSYTHATDFILGKAGDFATSPIIGSIDQVRIFDRALDSGEVAQLYNE